MRGGAPNENIVSSFVELLTRLVAQELLEAEQTDFLGGRYERRGDDKRGQRNGSQPGHVRSAEGDIELRVLQVRGADKAFCPQRLSFLEGNSEVLERLVAETDARGMSTRDIEDAFGAEDGSSLLSPSALSEVTDRLWAKPEAFLNRDLSGLAIHAVFVDAVFESLRRYGAKEAVLVCWGIGEDGSKHLVPLAVGNKESQRDWSELFRHMVDGGSANRRASPPRAHPGSSGRSNRFSRARPTAAGSSTWRTCDRRSPRSRTGVHGQGACDP